MMAKNYFDRYMSLIDTINRHGYIKFEDISRKWAFSHLNYKGEDYLPERTFFNHIDAILNIFGIEIKCNRTRGYYIANREEWENDDGKFKKFTFDSGPAVSGSWDILYLYNKKGLENGLHWHTTETRSYTESTNGYIQLQFNTKGDKLLRATISYLNNGVYTWDYHDSPIWEEMYDRTGTDKASAWSVVLSPEK